MKCPKCGYLGFEHIERCRNCGYDFLLSSAVADPDLRLKEAASALSADRIGLPDISLTIAAAPELPLFEGEEPLITKASPPRSPLAVRRSTPEVPRLRGQPRPATLEFGFDSRPPEPAPLLAERPADTAWADRPPMATVGGPALLAAGLGARLNAACIDCLILAAVDAVVIYFTLQICGVSLSELGLVPKVPLAVFLLVQNLGYLVAFTAGGQTLGKMAMGIRVVPAEHLDGLDVGHAMLRTLVWVVLAVPVGLGFLTALLERDHRGLHDRFAGTRVVRA